MKADVRLPAGIRAWHLATRHAEVRAAKLVHVDEALAGEHYDEDRFYAPTSAGDVQDTYDFGGGRLTLDGELIITSDKYRDQPRNRADALVHVGMHGTAEIQSEPGEGTAVHLHFPRTPEEAPCRLRRTTTRCAISSRSVKPTPADASKWKRRLVYSPLARILIFILVTVLLLGPLVWLIVHALRAQEQYHFRNEGYGSFDDFLDALSSRKRKALRKERAAARERPAERDLVRVLEVAAHRQAAGDPGDPHPERAEQLAEVERRRLTLDVRVRAEDDLGDALGVQPSEQLPHLELVRAHALHRVDGEPVPDGHAVNRDGLRQR